MVKIKESMFLLAILSLILLNTASSTYINPVLPVNDLETEIKTVTGTFEVIIYEDFYNKRTWKEYYLRTEKEEQYKILLDKEYNIKSGDIAILNGIIIENPDNEWDEFKVSQITNIQTKTYSREANPNLEEQSTVVLLTNFQDDLSEPINDSDAWTQIFSQTYESVNKWITEVSYGKAFLTGSVFPTDTETNGWYTLNLNTSDLCNGGGFHGVKNAAIEAADNDVNFQNYKRMFIMVYIITL